MSDIFISYRRDDSAGQAGRIQDHLERAFGPDSVFMDVDAIALGVNFVNVLRDEVAKCKVLLAVIGPNWLDISDEAGRRRLENPNDFVRIEIGAALERDIRVIPILLEATRMPLAEMLPDDLKELPQRHGINLRHGSFAADVDRLIQGLRALLPLSETITAAVSRGHRKRNAELAAWVIKFRDQHNRNPRIPELQSVFPTVPKTTAWRYCTQG